jgi:hypothetical protein
MCPCHVSGNNSKVCRQHTASNSIIHKGASQRIDTITTTASIIITAAAGMDHYCLAAHAQDFNVHKSHLQ